MHPIIFQTQCSASWESDPHGEYPWRAHDPICLQGIVKSLWYAGTLRRSEIAIYLGTSARTAIVQQADLMMMLSQSD